MGKDHLDHGGGGGDDHGHGGHSHGGDGTFFGSVKNLVLFVFQKLQIIYPEKRSAPTMSFYLEFNEFHFKEDKVCAGFINSIFIVFLLATSVITLIMDFV